MRWFKFQRTRPIRLEPQPWTGRTWRKRLPEITANVVAKSEYGIKIEQDGDWWNWSKPEYRGEPFNTEVQKGDRVQITYAETDGGKTYITTIGKVTAAPVGHPLVDESPPAFEVVPDATSEPPEPVLDKDRLIVRQVAIKAASEALAISPLDVEEKAGRITYLAGVFEDWVYR